MISVVEANGISTVAHSKSLTAMAMMYRLKVDRKFGFLYVAIQTRLFPMMLVILNAIQTLASVMTTGKLRLGNSGFSFLPKSLINNLKFKNV